MRRTEFFERRRVVVPYLHRRIDEDIIIQCAERLAVLLRWRKRRGNFLPIGGIRIMKYCMMDLIHTPFHIHAAREQIDKCVPAVYMRMLYCALVSVICIMCLHAFPCGIDTDAILGKPLVFE